jgi:hypothetical protein
MNSGEVLPLLERLDATGFNRVDEACLLGYCIGYGMLILRKYHQRDVYLLERAGYVAKDVALISLEKLLRPGFTHPASYLDRCISERRSDADTAKKKLAVLHELLLYAVRDTISSLMGETDQAYRRIRRGIRDVLRDHPDFTFIPRVFRERHYHLSTNMAPDLSRPECPVDSLLAGIGVEGRNAIRNADYAGSVTELLRFVEADDSCRDTLELRVITEVVLQMTRALWETDVDTRTTEIPQVPRVDIQAAIDATTQSIRQGVLAGYLRKGIYVDGQADRIRHALGSMLNDFSIDSIRPYYQYFQESFPEIPFDVYRRDHRSRFEYLAGKARTAYLTRISALYEDS